MDVALVDVDNVNRLNDCFPNLALMKLSAYHKRRGDRVQWFEPLEMRHFDRAYLSKVFSFTPDFDYFIDADEIIKGGTGYAIEIKDGRECFDKAKHGNLPEEIEHIFPDYSLYWITDTAYGFMSRGCPRGCGFCHVKDKEGLKSYKVANLSEFWNGQKYIELMDPNTLACSEWRDILGQLADSGATVNFNQGVDIRLMTEAKAEAIKAVKTKRIHFAFDRYEDGPIIKPRLEQFSKVSGFDHHKVSVYVLCNFNTTIEQDLERIMFIRSIDFQPYVMLYDKANIKRGSELLKLQRWVNSPAIFWTCPTFEEYKRR